MVLLSNELVELRVEHINGRSFLGEVECEHNGFTNFENLTKIENIEALLSLVGQIKSSYHLLTVAQILLIPRFLPLYHFFKSVSPEAGPLFLQRLHPLSLKILLRILQPRFKAIRRVLEYYAAIGDQQIFVVSVGFYFVVVESLEILHWDQG